MARGNRRGKSAAKKGSENAALRLRLLGPLAVFRDAQNVALPQSRKVRGLLAYLALAPRPAGRSQLCELLWDSPNDPRGELRWCLSRIRSVIGQRVVTEGDTIALDLSGCTVDAVEMEKAVRGGIESLDAAHQRDLVDAFAGDFLDGLEIERSPSFGAWLTAQRRRFRAVQAALLERLADGPDDDEALKYLDRWLELSPFDRSAHEKLLTRLAARGRLREGEEHLARTAQMFDAEGLDFEPLTETWRSARATSVIPSVSEESLKGSLASLGMTSAGMTASASRRSIAVMPFTDSSGAARVHGGIADALAFDVTTRLAKLRSMTVIAQGSTTALAERRIGPEEAGRMLNVDYVVGGSVRRDGRRLEAIVELVETRTAHIVWSEILRQDFKDTLLMLDEIGNRIVASVINEIEVIERNRAILRPPNSLDAWEAHHRGLWHVYRFTRDENQRALHFFQEAVRLDPTFGRAYAGLSFAHFQNYFLGWADPAQEVERAYATARQGVMADERDPASNWSMGRALWMRGQIDESLAALRKTIDLSPNFAMAHYAIAFVHSLSGDPAPAIPASDISRSLSPFDPLLFGMLGARAISLARLGQYDEAAEWALKSAARPNAHAHIFAGAAFILPLAGRLDEARALVARIKRDRPDVDFSLIPQAYHFAPDLTELFRKGARLSGLV